MRRAGHLNPVVHIVLFEDARGAKAVLGDKAHHVLDLRRRRLVDNRPTPDFHLIGPARVPDAESARQPVQRKVGENRARGGCDLARARRAEAAVNLRGMFSRIIGELGYGLRKPGAWVIRRDLPRNQGMAVAARDLAALAAAPRLACRSIDAEVARGAVSTGALVAVAVDILRRRLTVSIHHAAMRAAHFGSARAPVQENVEVPSHVSEIFL